MDSIFTQASEKPFKGKIASEIACDKMSFDCLSAAVISHHDAKSRTTLVSSLGGMQKVGLNGKKKNRMRFPPYCNVPCICAV